MLAPQDRMTFLSALRPPDGYSLDHAIGTTFTLDLLALLIAPLEFTLFNWKTDDGLPTSDPIALLEALRSNADRISIFCQAGAIAIPRKHQLLFSYLERSVFEVVPPAPGGVFHPKLWALRFTGPGKPPLYRLLVATRNLTFDRCWDTLFVMEGPLTARRNAYAAHHPLGNLIARLPDLCVRELSKQRAQEVERFDYDLRRVDFRLPDGFDEYNFHVVGLSGEIVWPFPTPRGKTLTMSPFLAESFLEKLTEGYAEHYLISRIESLEAVSPDVLDGLETIWVLNDQLQAATPEEQEGEKPDSLPMTGNELPTLGLHAKLFVFDDGWNARVFTGSSNATAAGFRNNVEILVELKGKKSICGVDVLLDSGRPGPTLRSLLQVYQPAERQFDEIQEVLDCRTDETRYALAAAPMRVEVTAANTDFFDLTIRSRRKLHIAEGVEVLCWPIHLAQEQWACPVDVGPEVASFQGVTFEAVTSFIAFEVKAAETGRSSAVRFVLNLPLKGAPEDRDSRILRALLRDKSRLIRLLLMLLATDGDDARQILLYSNTHGRKGGRWEEEALGMPLLEPLMRALDRDPEKLDQVSRLIEDLIQTDEGNALLPDGFLGIWEPIWKARAGD